MTTAEKSQMLKQLLGIASTDHTQDSLLSVYLDFAQKEIINWRYGDSKRPDILRLVNSEDNSVTIHASTFVSAVSPVSGLSYIFSYNDSAESWQYESANVELSDYGVGYSEDYEPVDGETIAVTYNDTHLARFDPVQIMACQVGFNQSGAEGQKSHGENGITRSFNYADMVEYIHKNVQPIIGVV